MESALNGKQIKLPGNQTSYFIIQILLIICTITKDVLDNVTFFYHFVPHFWANIALVSYLLLLILCTITKGALDIITCFYHFFSHLLGKYCSCFILFAWPVKEQTYEVPYWTIHQQKVIGSQTYISSIYEQIHPSKCSVVLLVAPSNNMNMNIHIWGGKFQLTCISDFFFLAFGFINH